MRLRWVITKHEVNSAEVKEYSEKMDISMKEAYRILEQKSQPKLQYLGDDDEWYDVPTEVITF